MSAKVIEKSKSKVLDLILMGMRDLESHEEVPQEGSWLLRIPLQNLYKEYHGPSNFLTLTRIRRKSHEDFG